MVKVVGVCLHVCMIMCMRTCMGMHVCAMNLKRENVLRVYWTVLSVLG